jgi:Protein of unknown function (DUF2917)
LDRVGRSDDHQHTNTHQEFTMQAAHQAPSLVRSLSVSEALTLCPREPGVLRVTQGRIWATIDLDRSRTFADAGDHFVVPGQDLYLRAGQRVVLEAWPVQGQTSIQWQWLPVATPMATSAASHTGLGRALVAAWRALQASAARTRVCAAVQSPKVCATHSQSW